MNETRKQEITELASAAHDANERYAMLSMMNVPQDFEERRKARIEIAIAQAELIDANNKLRNAINGVQIIGAL